MSRTDDTNLMLGNVPDAATGVAIIACAVDGSITVFKAVQALSGIWPLIAEA